jgi:myo-inositol-1(or 4)-monophosphatase
MSEHLDFATETAFRAGRFALSHFQRPIEISEKDDLSPVTAADRGAESLIRELIETAYPNHGILGEEMGQKESKENHRWIVDPIDGTRSFIHGVPLWGVLIGLEIDREVVVGVCYLPAVDEMFAAAVGEGCRWNGRPCHVSQTSTLSVGGDGLFHRCGGLGANARGIFVATADECRDAAGLW